MRSCCSRPARPTVGASRSSRGPDRSPCEEQAGQTRSRRRLGLPARRRRQRVQVGVAGLHAVALNADGGGPATVLTERFQSALGVASPQAMVPKIYGELDRPRWRHWHTSSSKLPTLVTRSLRRSWTASGRVASPTPPYWPHAGLSALPKRTVVAGGLFVSCPTYRNRFLAAVNASGIMPAPLAIVAEPAEGAFRLAVIKMAS